MEKNPAIFCPLYRSPSALNTHSIPSTRTKPLKTATYLCYLTDKMGTPAATFLSLVVAAATLAMPCLAAHFTVGEANGWDLSTNFGDWLDGKTFHVGDTLGFKYTSMHNVVEVSKADYAACQAGNALKTYTDGHTTVPLKTAGTKYFVCGVPGHCASGMKVAIAVKATASGASSPTSTPPTEAPAATAKAPAASDTPSEAAASSDTKRAPATMQLICTGRLPQVLPLPRLLHD